MIASSLNWSRFCAIARAFDSARYLKTAVSHDSLGTASPEGTQDALSAFGPRNCFRLARTFAAVIGTSDLDPTTDASWHASERSGSANQCGNRPKMSRCSFVATNVTRADVSPNVCSRPSQRIARGSPYTSFAPSERQNWSSVVTHLRSRHAGFL